MPGRRPAAGLDGLPLPPPAPVAPVPLLVLPLVQAARVSAARVTAPAETARVLPRFISGAFPFLTAGGVSGREPSASRSPSPNRLRPCR